MKYNCWKKENSNQDPKEYISLASQNKRIYPRQDSNLISATKIKSTKLSTIEKYPNIKN